MSEWMAPSIRPEPVLQGPVTQLGSDPYAVEDANKRRRKLRGPMMALADEDLRLSIAGKQQLGA